MNKARDFNKDKIPNLFSVLPLGNQREYSVFMILFAKVLLYVEDKCLYGKKKKK